MVFNRIIAIFIYFKKGGKKVGNDRFFNLKEVASILDISVRTAYRMAQSGELPAKKIRGSWRVDPAKLDRYLVTDWDKKCDDY